MPKESTALATPEAAYTTAAAAPIQIRSAASAGVMNLIDQLLDDISALQVSFSSPTSHEPSQSTVHGDLGGDPSAQTAASGRPNQPTVILSSLSGTAAMAGPLLKLFTSRTSGLTSWRSLFFVLSGFRLYAFRSSHPEEVMRLSFDLSLNVSVSVDDDLDDEDNAAGARRCIIELRTPPPPQGLTETAPQKAWVLSADSIDEGREWFRALHSAAAIAAGVAPVTSTFTSLPTSASRTASLVMAGKHSSQQSNGSRFSSATTLVQAPSSTGAPSDFNTPGSPTELSQLQSQQHGYAQQLQGKPGPFFLPAAQSAGNMSHLQILYQQQRARQPSGDDYLQQPQQQGQGKVHQPHRPAPEQAPPPYTEYQPPVSGFPVLGRSMSQPGPPMHSQVVPPPPVPPPSRASTNSDDTQSKTDRSVRSAGAGGSSDETRKNGSVRGSPAGLGRSVTVRDNIFADAGKAEKLQKTKKSKKIAMMQSLDLDIL
ncbi:hypothetical protein DFJ73DRAFT_775494 [Zopfochytrium polystomum]|nr:hypothetical protein DFJ73DRAFT_775494 [Zopfochytrium polystomum]